jgi:hypothetical protein
MALLARAPESGFAKALAKRNAQQGVLIDWPNVLHTAQGLGREHVLDAQLVRVHAANLLACVVGLRKVPVTTGYIATSRTDTNARALERVRREASEFNLDVISTERCPITNTEVGVDEALIDAGLHLLGPQYRRMEHLVIVSGDHCFMRVAADALRAGTSVTVYAFACSLGRETLRWYEEHHVEVEYLDDLYPWITFVEGKRFPRRR